MPTMPIDDVFVEPGDGHVVVVRASRAPDGAPESSRLEERYAVIIWGTFELVSHRMAGLSKDEAIFEARHCAAERGRNAWDSTGKQMVKLPRLPLVYRGVGATYVVRVDATDYTDPRASLLWKSAALLGKAPMPLACS